MFKFLFGNKVRAKVPTAAGELLLAVDALRDAVEQLGRATHQRRGGFEFGIAMDEVEVRLQNAEELLVEKLPDREA
jgi:hypothetical protein